MASYFLKSKDELSKTVREFIKDLKARYGIDVKTITCDNAGKNKKFEKDLLKDGMGLKFKYTAVNTPQQNGQIERNFASLYGCVRAMLNIV